MKKIFLISGMAGAAGLTYIMLNKSMRKKAEKLIDDMLDEAQELMEMN